MNAVSETAADKAKATIAQKASHSSGDSPPCTRDPQDSELQQKDQVRRQVAQKAVLRACRAKCRPRQDRHQEEVADHRHAFAPRARLTPYPGRESQEHCILERQQQRRPREAERKEGCGAVEEESRVLQIGGHRNCSTWPHDFRALTFLMVWGATPKASASI